MLAKIGADRAENGQHLAEILSPNQRLVLRGSSWGICHAPTNDFFYVARLGVSATVLFSAVFLYSEFTDSDRQNAVLAEVQCAVEDLLLDTTGNIRIEHFVTELSMLMNLYIEWCSFRRSVRLRGPLRRRPAAPRLIEEHDLNFIGFHFHIGTPPLVQLLVSQRIGGRPQLK